MNNAIIEVNRDFHLTEPINQVRELLNHAKLNSPAQYSDYFGGLSERMRASTELQLHSTSGFLNQNILRPLMGATYAYKLIRPGRLTIEAISETYRVGFGAGKDLKNVPEALQEHWDKAQTSINNIANLARKENPLDTMTSFEKLLEYTDSPFVHRYSRHDIEFNKELGHQNSPMNKMAQWLMGMVDRNTMHMAYMPAFRQEFKKLTGEQFSSKKFNTDPNYAETYKKEIKEAGAIGNRAAGQWKNISVKGAGRYKIQLPVGSVKATSGYAPILTYMGSFGALEAAMYQKGFRDMLQGESPAARASGFKQAMTIFSAGMGYGLGVSAEFLLMGYGIQSLIIKDKYDIFGSADEEAELDALWKETTDELWKIMTPKGTVQQVVSNASFLVTSKYSGASRGLAILSAGLYKEMVKGGKVTETKEELNMLEGFIAKMANATPEDIDDITRGGLYFQGTFDAGDFSEQMLQHVKLGFETIRDFPPDFWKAYEAGDIKGMNSKFREELRYIEALNSAQKLFFMFKGAQFPGQRHIDEYLRGMSERYDVNQADITNYRKLVFPKAQEFPKAPVVRPTPAGEGTAPEYEEERQIGIFD